MPAGRPPRRRPRPRPALRDAYRATINRPSRHRGAGPRRLARVPGRRLDAVRPRRHRRVAGLGPDREQRPRAARAPGRRPRPRRPSTPPRRPAAQGVIRPPPVPNLTAGEIGALCDEPGWQGHHTTPRGRTLAGRGRPERSPGRSLEERQDLAVDRRRPQHPFARRRHPPTASPERRRASTRHTTCTTRKRFASDGRPGRLDADRACYRVMSCAVQTSSRSASNPNSATASRDFAMNGTSTSALGLATSSRQHSTGIPGRPRSPRSSPATSSASSSATPAGRRHRPAAGFTPCSTRSPSPRRRTSSVTANTRRSVGRHAPAPCRGVSLFGTLHGQRSSSSKLRR